MQSEMYLIVDFGTDEVIGSVCLSAEQYQWLSSFNDGVVRIDEIPEGSGRITTSVHRDMAVYLRKPTEAPHVSR